MMKKILSLMATLFAITVIGCTGSENQEDNENIEMLTDSIKEIYITLPSEKERCEVKGGAQATGGSAHKDVNTEGLPMVKDRKTDYTLDNNHSEQEIQEASYQIVKAAVKKQLTNPSSADFSLLSVNREKFGKSTFRYRGTLTAKNAFGIKEELRYLVTLTYFEGNPMDVSSWNITTCEVKPNY